MLTQIRNIRKTILPTQLPSTFLNTCVYTRSISTMKHTHVALAPSFPASPSTHPSPQSHWNTRDDHNSVSGSNPGSFMVMMQIPSHQQTMPTSSAILFQEFQNYQANIETHSSYSKLIRPRSLPCSKSSKIVRRTLRRIPSYSKLTWPRSLPLIIQSLGWAETCCSSSCWSAPPSWSSTNMFQLCSSIVFFVHF